MKKVGTVTHYFAHPEVAALDLEGEIAVGDKLQFQRGGEELFEQEVTSLEVEHKKVEKAGKGSDVAMKVDQKVREGTEVYKIE